MKAEIRYLKEGGTGIIQWPNPVGLHGGLRVKKHVSRLKVNSPSQNSSFSSIYLLKFRIMETLQIRATGKAIKGATYKQYKLLESLENVELDITVSKFPKRISIQEASEAIECDINGGKVEIWY